MDLDQIKNKEITLTDLKKLVDNAEIQVKREIRLNRDRLENIRRLKNIRLENIRLAKIRLENRLENKLEEERAFLPPSEEKIQEKIDWLNRKGTPSEIQATTASRVSNSSFPKKNRSFSEEIQATTPKKNRSFPNEKEKYKERKQRQKERDEKDNELLEQNRNMGVILLETANCLIQSDKTIIRFIPKPYFSSIYPVIPEMEKYFTKDEIRIINSDHNIQHYLRLLFAKLPMNRIKQKLLDDLIITKDNLKSLGRFIHTPHGKQRDEQDSYLNEIRRLVSRIHGDVFSISPEDFNFQSGIQHFAGQDMPYLNWRNEIASIIIQRLNCGIYFLQNISLLKGGKSRKKYLYKNKSKRKYST